ncbi:MAG: lytic transglycosylase F [Bacteroidetes bacterium]|nr:MAG: lytic transglycosylase F [Bacteroidota bacterium]
MKCRKSDNIPATLQVPEQNHIDLDQIKERGKLIALTDNSTTSYFIYKGTPMGYEHDLLNLLAEHLGVDLEIVVVKNMDDIIDMLIKGKGDIIAANLTVTQERAEKINFTEHHILTRQVLVQRKPDGWKKMRYYDEIEKKLIRNQIDLIGKGIHVRKNSSFYTRLKSLSDEIGGKINIVEAPGDHETEFLISQVAKGEIDYTVADENVARVNQNYYSNIDVKTVISFPQKIAWAVNKDTPELLEEINKWIKSIRNKNKYVAVYNKYFKNHGTQKLRVESDYFSYSETGGGKISKYDHIIKTYSKKIDWDWRLLASQIYQESNFDPQAESWAGAFGLMQLIPTTASLYGVDSLSTAAQNVMAGTKYLSWLNDYWKGIIIEKQERTKFILGSYNVGLGHIIDARNLAIKYNKDPNTWDDNVAWFVLQKSRKKYYNDEVVKHGYCRGEEPYNYVKNILSRYEHYKNVNI